MIPEVTRRVIGRMPKNRPANLGGFRRFCVAGATYPGIIPESGEQVEGLLLLYLSPVEFELLNRYEGSEYRLEVHVVYASKDKLEASVYVYTNLSRVTAVSWAFPDDIDFGDLGLSE